MVCPSLVTLDDPSASGAALRSGADALVLDLGAAAPGDRGARRGLAAAILSARGRSDAAGIPTSPFAVVGLAALPSGLVDADLDAVMAGAPEAVLLPRCVGRRDLQHLAAKLAVREAEHGLRAGRTLIVAAPADTAAGVLALPGLPGASPRLRAVVWDAGALSAALGVGVEATSVRHARDLLLVAAAAAGIPAIDAGLPCDDLAAACAAARREGFAGRIARGPGEAAVIALAFGRPV